MVESHVIWFWASMALLGATLAAVAVGQIHGVGRAALFPVVFLLLVVQLGTGVVAVVKGRRATAKDRPIIKRGEEWRPQ